MTMNKWIAISLGTLVGLSHIGMIGMISLGQTQSIMANKFLLSKWIYKGE